MSAALEVLDRVTDTVDYLRVTVAEPDQEIASVDPTRHAEDQITWLSCDRLTTDQAALGELARSTAAGRGTDRDDVAMSLLVQGYVFRIASLAIGAWLLDDVVLDMAPSRTSIAMGRDEPNAVRLDEPRLVAAEDPAGALHDNLVDGHLASLVGTAHAACRVGEALLWSNVGASCASSFAAFMGPLPDRRIEIRERAEAFFATARPEVAESGTIVAVGSDWAWERRACCLWYRTEGGFRCADCSLWSAEERQARYDERIARATEGEC